MTWIRITASVLVLFAGTAVAATQTPSFSTRLEAVRVDVLVTENGRIVRGLGASDFEVRDNGVLQQVNLVSFEQIPLNVVLALDMSQSVSGERLDHLRSAGRALIDGLTAADRGGLVTFSHRVALREGLTADVARLRSALALARPLGETSLVDGTYAAMMLGAADVGRGLLIVFSDGVDTSSWLSPDRVLEAARHSDVVVYGVVVRASEGPAFLRDLSGLTGGTVLEVESTRDLAGRFVGVLNEFRQRYLVSYSPVGVSRSGWHRLDVRVKDRKASVKARAGYTGS